MSGRVTLEDIAEASQASPASVSLALRNKPGVSQATRQRILDAAQALGYQRPARQEADDGAELLNIALIFRTWDEGPERTSPALNRFYSWVLTGIQESALPRQLNLILTTIPVDEQNLPGVLPKKTLRQQLDGALIVGSFRPETIETVRELTAVSRPPMVLVDAAADELDCVVTENELAGHDATVHLIRQGHRRIGYFGPDTTWEPNFRLRRDGFAQAMADHGLSVAAIVEELVSVPQAMRAAPHALQAAPDATAFVCGNDDYAYALLQAARAAGRAVPNDLSIIGCDDTDRALASVPALTTMAVDKLSLGRLAVELLAYRLAWPEAAPIRVAVRPRLIERASVRTLAARGNGRGDLHRE